MIKGYPEVTFCLDLKYVLDKFSYERTFKNFFKKIRAQGKVLKWIKRLRS